MVQISDSQPAQDDEQAWKKTKESIALVNRLKPDFVIFAGDVTATGSVAEHRRMRRILAAVKAPVHLVPGNHDMCVPGVCTPADESVPVAELRRAKTKLFNKYLGPDAWSFEYGDYLFAGFDSCETPAELRRPWYDPQNLTPERRDWLEAILSETSKPYKVLVVHHYQPPPGTLLTDLLDAHAVLAYMHGHDHKIKAYVDEATHRLILDSGSAVQIPDYGVLVVDVEGHVWQVSWHPVKGKVRDLGSFDVKEVLSKLSVGNDAAEGLAPSALPAPVEAR